MTSIYGLETLTKRVDKLEACGPAQRTLNRRPTGFSAHTIYAEAMKGDAFHMRWLAMLEDRDVQYGSLQKFDWAFFTEAADEQRS